MALGPKLSSCFKNSCATLSLTDTSGGIDEISTGWGGANGDTGDVTAATITVTSPTGDDIVVDVLSQLPESYTGDFSFDDIDITAQDGKWTIAYTVTIDDVDYTGYLCLYVTCAVRCCLDKLWCKWLASLDSDDCGCGCSDSNKLYDKVIFMESLYKALKNCAASRTDAARDKLLKQIQRLCNLENCNC